MNKQINIELDERLKIALNVRNELMVPLLKFLYNINVRVDSKFMLKPNEHLVNENGKRVKRITDVEILIEYPTGYVEPCHIEFQLQHYEDLAKRLFQYGVTNLYYNDEVGYACFPRQVGVCIRKDDNIESKNTLTIYNFGLNPAIEYSVDLIKFWEYDVESLYQMKLYTLMPFTLLRFENDLHGDALQKEYDKIIDYCNLLLDTRDYDNYLEYDEDYIPLTQKEIEKIITDSMHFVKYIMQNNTNIDIRFKGDDLMVYNCVEDAKIALEVERQRLEEERQRLEEQQRYAEAQRQRADKESQKVNRLIELLKQSGIEIPSEVLEDDSIKFGK